MNETRSGILARFRRKIAAGQPIIGGGAGTGISAKFEEAGGIDLIVIYNSGRFRMAGHGSLAGLMPFGDANAIVLDMAAEVLPVVKRTPVLAGVCGTDPMRRMERFLTEIRDIGFAGVQNFPTVGLIDGSFRANLEETSMGYDREVAMIRMARRTGPVDNSLRLLAPGRRPDDAGGCRHPRGTHGTHHVWLHWGSHCQDPGRMRPVNRCHRVRGQGAPPGRDHVVPWRPNR